MKKYCENCGRCLENLTNMEKCQNPSCSGINTHSSDSGNPSENPQPENPSPLSHLKVIKGDLFNTVKRVKRTQDLLVFSNAVLWPDRDFPEYKRLQLYPLIAEHFRESKDIDQTFRELIERTVLAKRWEDEKEYRFLPPAERWFDIERIDGLYFTHGLYGRMLTQRNTLPKYEHGLTLISEAILSYIDEKNLLEIYPYREKFIRLNRMDLLNYYFSAIMHIQFINL